MGPSHARTYYLRVNSFPRDTRLDYNTVTVTLKHTLVTYEFPVTPSQLQPLFLPSRCERGRNSLVRPSVLMDERGSYFPSCFLCLVSSGWCTVRYCFIFIEYFYWIFILNIYIILVEVFFIGPSNINIQLKYYINLVEVILVEVTRRSRAHHGPPFYEINATLPSLLSVSGPTKAKAAAPGAARAPAQQPRFL